MLPEVLEDDSAQAATPFEQFMKDRNRTILGTVGYGDCGLDLMCMMNPPPVTNSVSTMHGRHVWLDAASLQWVEASAASDTESDGTNTNS